MSIVLLFIATCACLSGRIVFAETRESDHNLCTNLVFNSQMMPAAAAASGDFPSCSRRDPELGRCIFNSIHQLKPQFSTGKLSPELTIDPLDPFYLPSISFGRTRLSKVTFSDIYIIGATDFNLKDIKWVLPLANGG
jgi:hypothetical protein